MQKDVRKKSAKEKVLTIDLSVYWFTVYCIQESMNSSMAIRKLNVGF